MGQSSSIIKKINYEDIQNRNKNVLLLNTLSETKQACLIKGTIHAKDEERLINDYYKQGELGKTIFLYGEHSNDQSLNNKYNQLLSLGFTNIYVYLGGMFEWLCLQDIYGEDLFPTTSEVVDLLQYKPTSNLIKLAISYH